MMLACWQEVVGELKDVRDNGDGTITLIILTKQNALEVTVIGDVDVFKRLINTKIGVLRVDSSDKPYRIRVISTRLEGGRKRC